MQYLNVNKVYDSMNIFGGSIRHSQSMIQDSGPYLFILLEETEYHFVNELDIEFPSYRNTQVFLKNQYKGSNKQKYNLNVNLNYEWLLDADTRTAPRFEIKVYVAEKLIHSKVHGVYDRLNHVNILDENFILDLNTNDTIRITLVQSDNDDISIKKNSFYKVTLI